MVETWVLLPTVGASLLVGAYVGWFITAKVLLGRLRRDSDQLALDMLRLTEEVRDGLWKLRRPQVDTEKGV